MMVNHVEGCKARKMSAGYQNEFDRKNGISSIIETLGGANVTQLFVHSVTPLGTIAELDKILPGFERYTRKAIGNV